MSEIHHITKKRKRSQNTTPEQFERYLQEMENDYVFRSNTINPTLEPDYLVKKWEILTADLNSIGTGPELTVEEWKKRFQDWKYSIKSKFRKITEDSKKTGGGPQLNLQLTPLEQRGLNVFGKITVLGANVTPYEGLLLPQAVVATCSSEGEGVNTVEDNNFNVNNITEAEVSFSNKSSDNILKEMQNGLEETPSGSRSNSTSKPKHESRRNYYNRVKPLSHLAERLLEVSESANFVNSGINDTLKVFCEEYINFKKETLRFEIAKFKFLNKDFDFQ